MQRRRHQSNHNGPEKLPIGGKYKVLHHKEVCGDLSCQQAVKENFTEKIRWKPQATKKMESSLLFLFHGLFFSELAWFEKGHHHS